MPCKGLEMKLQNAQNFFFFVGNIQPLLRPPGEDELLIILHKYIAVIYYHNTNTHNDYFTSVSYLAWGSLGLSLQQSHPG